MAEDLYERYKSKEKDFKELHTRMDKDRELYELDPYKLRDFENKPIDKVVSSTLNDPAVFAHRTIAILGAADPQIVAESDSLKQSQTIEVEKYLEGVETETDNRLTKMIRGLAFMFFCEQACVRGWLAGASLLREKNGRLVVDRRPLDSRCVRFEEGIDGLEWGSYTTVRSGRKIKDQYGLDISPAESAEVIDIYSKTRNQVYIQGNDKKSSKNVKDVEHPFKWEGEGYVPFVIQPIPAGSQFQDGKPYVKQGESIFVLDRALYEKMNEMASILENLTMASFFAAKQYESEVGEEAESPEVSPYQLGAIVSVEKGGGFKLIPLADIRNATRLLYSIYEQRIQRGSLPNINYGNLTFPLSGAAIKSIQEPADMIFIPRLNGLAMFYQQLDRMSIRQYRQLGRDLTLGEEGDRKVFPVKSLKGEYTIKRKYFSVDPVQDIANTSIAQAHRDLGLPEEYIFRNTLKLRDPDGVMILKRSERAELINPVIMLRRLAISLVQREEDFEAELVLQSAEDLLIQRSMGQSIVNTAEDRKQLQGRRAVPLLEEGAGGRHPPKSEQERAEEEMNEEERIGRLAETAREGRRTPA